jgi:hypothetical protein
MRSRPRRDDLSSLVSVSLDALARQRSHCAMRVSTCLSRSEMPPTKKPFQRNVERLFQELLNRDAKDHEGLTADAEGLTGYRCRAAHRSTSRLPVINGSDFPNGDAPAPCGTRGDDDTAQRRPGR